MQLLNPSEISFYKEQTDFFKGKSGIYLLLDKKQTVVYVGMAASIGDRVKAHFDKGSSQSKVFKNSFDRFTVFLIEGKRRRMELEKFLIKHLDLLENIQHHKTRAAEKNQNKNSPLR